MRIISLCQSDELLAQPVESMGVGVKPTASIGEFGFADPSKPARKVVLVVFQAQPGVEDVEINALDADLAKDFGKLGQTMRDMARGEHECPRRHEVKLLTVAALQTAPGQG
jgi:hypothetical protein